MKTFVMFAFTLATAASTATVDSDLRAKILSGVKTEAILQLPCIMPQVTASQTLQSLSGDAKVSALVSTLQGLTGAAQAPYVTKLKELGFQHQQFWASNIILIKNLNAEGLLALEEFMDLDEEVIVILRPPFSVSVDPIVHDYVHVNANATQTAQRGVEKIRAPLAWTMTQGEGIVVGIIDTGVNVGHIALAKNFAGAGAWLDPLYNEPSPTDVNGHGTHCMGIIAGQTNGIGVAPAATWVACRGINHQGGGSESAITTCAEFMITATPRPQVVSNSWGGGQGETWFNSQLSAWRVAAIIPVFAMGNTGPNCTTATSPADQPGAIAVGSTTGDDSMSGFSSRGPAPNGSLKPDVVAPGNNIISAATGLDNYIMMSGTSTAAPHVAGTIALMLTEYPGAQVSLIYSMLTRSAIHPTLSNADKECGLPASGDFPNYAFGYGRIDAASSIGL